jgi:BCD family chlorophyll transporter-like MFS transporter
LSATEFGWWSIVRLGLVQSALGAIVVLTTSTLNRVMVVELALPAMVPGVLVGLHYAIQLMRPRFGYGTDVGGRSTPWIIGGMAVLALGGVTAAVATAWMAQAPRAGLLLAFFAFGLIGVGVGAAGTSMLAMLAKRVAPNRRPAAATIVWVMMIAGFAITAGLSGPFLDPFSPERLVMVSAVVAAIAFCVAVAAVWNVERDGGPVAVELLPRPTPQPFRVALAEVWSEPRAREFTVFVFVSMLAYSAQDLILEPFAGLVFALTPGESTRLSGVQNGGVLLGMVVVGVTGTAFVRGRLGSMRAWTVGGCAASAAAFVALAIGAYFAPQWPLAANVFLLGVCNGAFAVAAIGSMMALAGEGRAQREGTRMGVWGAAQAMAFGLGGFLGTAAIDAMRWWLDSAAAAYAGVFLLESAAFVVAGTLAARIGRFGVGEPIGTVRSRWVASPN